MINYNIINTFFIDISVHLHGFILLPQYHFIFNIYYEIWRYSPKFLQIISFLCLHSLCFGSDLDVIFLMYLISCGFSLKPTSSSSSSTQVSQERWSWNMQWNQNIYILLHIISVSYIFGVHASRPLLYFGRIYNE